jgi:2-polyprenyl-3-methyl-5-hydroxy-6-metoxy-1,4-benzoquinol methylase
MKEKIAEKLLALVRDNYQEIAVSFAVTRDKNLGEAISRQAALVPAGARVLDAACGSGRLFQAFSGRDIDYQGFDGSPALITLAQERYPEASFSVADILDVKQDVRFPAGSYDFIFCLAALQHLPGRRRRLEALRGLATKLKSDGRLILSNWNLRSLPKYRFHLWRQNLACLFGLSPYDRNDLVFPWQGNPGKGSLRYYHAFSLGELASLAREAGLTVVEEKLESGNIWLTLEKKN